MPAPQRQLHLFKGKRQRGTAQVRNPREFQVTCALADVLRRWASPGWKWTHFPAGEERPAEEIGGQRVSFAGERLARMGTQKGWPDFILVAPAGHPRAGVAHFLELKRRRGGVLTDAQADFEAWCRVNGAPHAVARELKDAVAVLIDWGALRGKVEVQ